MATDLTRRRLLFGLLLGVAWAAQPHMARAESGDGGGSDDGDDDSGDDDGGDDSNDDDGEDDDSGNGANGGAASKSEAQLARDAVQARKAVPLRTLLAHLSRHYPGKVLDVDLRRSFISYTYHVKILSRSGKVERLRFNALTLQRI